MELDLALGAARAADDRRRVTAVLGAAPQAALFGPSPVARAGGRCLDVVRLLRITTASPSVEAASKRCQAVLEALRGRFDVSRSMLASARASLEELGLRHGLRETELFAGMVELIAGDPGAAIAPLRAAYEGLGHARRGRRRRPGRRAARDRAARAGRDRRGRADGGRERGARGPEPQDRDRLAGRAGRVLAARGDLARRSRWPRRRSRSRRRTDLVIDHADACVVLADLRGPAGDAAGARAARADARRLYEEKGATVPAERLASAANRSVDPVPTSAPRRDPSPASSTSGARTALVENAMTRVHPRCVLPSTVATTTRSAA